MSSPTIVQRAPALVPQGGQQPLSLATGALTTVAKWESPDGQPRRGTITLTGRTAPMGVNAGIVAKVTIGSSNGLNVFWFPCPQTVPFVGTKVTVEMALAKPPPALAYDRQRQTVGPWNGFGAAGVTAAIGAAFISDVWSDFPPSYLITQWDSIGSLAGLPAAFGPVWIEGASITNTSASAVQLVIFDSQINFGSSNPEPSTKCIVPAQTTLGLGSQLLGAFFNGLQIQAVVDLTAGAPLFGGLDAAGNSATFVSASGVFYPIGQN